MEQLFYLEYREPFRKFNETINILKRQKKIG